ncbi:Glutamine synthetase [Aphelenchoides besseyi]|nr:Glutamine synthetase [Aphelenchoides besseyi]
MSAHYNFNVKLPLRTPTIDQFLGIKPPQKCQATYVWIDGTGENLRSKTRTLNSTPHSLADYPVWNYDGSSTYQARGRDSDLYLHPRAVYQDPFLGPNARLIMCDTYTYQGKPTATNYRYDCAAIMSRCAKEHPWFGMEQEYLMLDRDGVRSFLSFNQILFPVSIGLAETRISGRTSTQMKFAKLNRVFQGPYYCSVGSDRSFGREIVETHYRASLWAGINICGTNAVTPGQWEFQVGPCEGVDMGDQLWIARYLLHRVAEQFGVLITLDPKPAVTSTGEWNGAGCHCNFSTKAMRDPNGLTAIVAAMPKLERFHTEHLLHYDANNGVDNMRRLSGRCETSDAKKFSWGIADRGASVRIPRQVAEDKRGYLEDRRPSSNCDPYRVTARIADAILLN